MKRRRLIRLIFCLLLFLALGATVLVWRQEAVERQFNPQIKAAAEKYNIDPLLVKAIVWRESRFKPDIRGRAGEIGLMQIQEIAAQEWADAERIMTFDHLHCFDPGTNTMAGTFYFAKVLKRYQQTDNPIPYALADYNAGRGNLLKWNKGAGSTNSEVFIAQIGFPTTKHYVKTVMRRYELYRFLRKFGLS